MINQFEVMSYDELVHNTQIHIDEFMYDMETVGVNVGATFRWIINGIKLGMCLKDKMNEKQKKFTDDVFSAIYGGEMSFIYEHIEVRPVDNKEEILQSVSRASKNLTSLYYNFIAIIVASGVCDGEANQDIVDLLDENLNEELVSFGKLSCMVKHSIPARLDSLCAMIIEMILKSNENGKLLSSEEIVDNVFEYLKITEVINPPKNSDELKESILNFLNTLTEMNNLICEIDNDR